MSQPVKIEEQGGGTCTIDKPSPCRFVCTVPGHGAADMGDTITVQ